MIKYPNFFDNKNLQKAETISFDNYTIETMAKAIENALKEYGIRKLINTGRKM